MARETLIRQKIAELTQQITHFEQCIEKAKQHQATLQQALQNDPFSDSIKRKAKSIDDGLAIIFQKCLNITQTNRCLRKR